MKFIDPKCSWCNHDTGYMKILEGYKMFCNYDCLELYTKETRENTIILKKIVEANTALKNYRNKLWG